MVTFNPRPLVMVPACSVLNALASRCGLIQRTLGAVIQRFYFCAPRKGIGNSKHYASRVGRGASFAHYIRARIKEGTGFRVLYRLLYIPAFFLPYLPLRPFFYFYQYFSTS